LNKNNYLILILINSLCLNCKRNFINMNNLPKHITLLFFILINITLCIGQKKFIVLDQFGYRPISNKIAVIRSAEVGYDSNEKFSPGSSYAVVESTSGKEVFTGNIIPWNNGQVHGQSGDKVWHFDFSSLIKEGEYYILDKSKNEKSFPFKIAKDVYIDVLKAAFKTFYYQRSGFEKKAQWAGANWADGASHVKAGQDKNARVFNEKNNAAKEKDLSGGWYDAGDYNKYTPWHANYLIAMLKMYLENKSAWTDDFNIPESGNQIPDLIDEVVFGLEWLKKLQQADGACLSVVGCASGTPPSAASGPSYYGLPSTYAATKSAEAFAYAAYVFKDIPQLQNQVPSLITKAKLSYDWAVNNPNVIFNNNSSSNGSQGLAAGNQETNELGRETSKLGANIYLYLATNEAKYKEYFENNYQKLPLIMWTNYISQYFLEGQDLFFEYLKLKDKNNQIADRIQTATSVAMKRQDDFVNAINNNLDPYMAYNKDFNWGSNQYKAAYGNFFTALASSSIDNQNKDKYLAAAEGYIHYIHGRNPLNLVYLTGMKGQGADQNVTQFYHTWFSDKSKWDTEGISQFGPAPGFLVGGPNPSYTPDGCCPSNCGSTSNNALCNSISLTPPLNQPPMKAYKDFNESWPLNSWAISENSNGYQVAYLRLLSKFVSSNITNTKDERVTFSDEINIYPNPTSQSIAIALPDESQYSYTIVDLHSKKITSDIIRNKQNISIMGLNSGQYILMIYQGSKLKGSKSFVIAK
jgi:endoglucanase